MNSYGFIEHRAITRFLIRASKRFVELQWCPLSKVHQTIKGQLYIYISITSILALENCCSSTCCTNKDVSFHMPWESKKH